MAANDPLGFLASGPQPSLGTSKLTPPKPTSNYDGAIRSAASMAGIPFDIGNRLVGAESSYDPTAANPSGARGLTQLLPGTAKQMGVRDLNDPTEQLAGGFKYLAQMRQQFGSMGLALAAYNWGPGNVADWLKKGGKVADLPKETRAYIAKIAPDEFAALSKSRVSRTRPTPMQHSLLAKMDRRVAGAKDPLGFLATTPEPTATASPSPTPSPAHDPMGFLPSASPSPSPSPTPHPDPSLAVNPMDTNATPDGPSPAQSFVASPTGQFAADSLAQVGGTLSLFEILQNASLRDGGIPILQALRNPKSFTSQAMALYRQNPAAANDEYGYGSPAQNQFMAQNFPNTGEGRFSGFMNQHPRLNAATTMGEGFFSPLSWAAGGLAGKAGSAVSDAAEAARVAKAAGTSASRLQKAAHAVTNAGQAAARSVGMGSPLYDIFQRAGVEGSQWTKGMIASVAAPHVLLHMESTPDMLAHIFGGLSEGEQQEVVRLSEEGTEPDPHYFKQYTDLAKRATLLRADIEAVTEHQVRTGILNPDENQVFNKKRYFPMSNSYDFGPQHDLEQQLLQGNRPSGGGTTKNYSKTYKTFDQARNSGNLDADFSAPVNYATWRNQRLQRVAFEDAMQRAPESLRRDLRPGDVWDKTNGPRATVPATQLPGEHPIDALIRFAEETRGYNIGESAPRTVEREYTIPRAGRMDPDNPDAPIIFDDLPPTLQKQAKTVWEEVNTPKFIAGMKTMSSSPTLRRSLIAPELYEFVAGNNGLRKYITAAGSQLPGQENTFAGKFAAIYRNSIISNFFWHPGANIAGNDAAARTLYNLPGNRFEFGGYLANTAKSFATQVGLKSPASFVGGVQEYAHWLDRAMKAGGTAEFGMPRTAAMGGEYAKVVTESTGPWLQRLKEAVKTGDFKTAAKKIGQSVNRGFTKAGDFNRDRTFGAKGEQAFAVSLFKDAVESGMSDADAGQVVREALGDYYNFDPSSVLSTFNFFMPWRKSNWKFWAKVFTQKPQLVLGPAHAIRNYNIQTNPDAMTGPFPRNDFQVQDDPPRTLPFVGRDIGHLVNLVGDIPQGPRAIANDLVPLALGSGTPATQLYNDAMATNDAGYRPDVAGPETNYNLLYNPKAPTKVQYLQLAENVAARVLPIPLVGYAVQRAAQKGFSPKDFAAALLSSVGAGYEGVERLDDGQRKQLKAAQGRYKIAYDRYTYDDHDAQALQDAWDAYTAQLKQIGVIH